LITHPYETSKPIPPPTKAPHVKKRNKILPPKETKAIFKSPGTILSKKAKKVDFGIIAERCGAAPLFFEKEIGNLILVYRLSANIKFPITNAPIPKSLIRTPQ